jgi:hypothetical protein
METNSRVRTPIVTVAQEFGIWKVATWSSDNTGIISSENYTDFKTAEIAAKAFAERNELAYVVPNSKFVSIVSHPMYGKKVYITLVVSFLGADHMCKKGFELFEHAFNYAKHRAEKKQLAFAPYWYLGTTDQRATIERLVEPGSVEMVSPSHDPKNRAPDDRDLTLPD